MYSEKQILKKETIKMYSAEQQQKKPADRAFSFSKIIRWLMLLGLAYAIFAPSGIVHAAPAASGAEAQWEAVIDFLVPWIQRLGGVVMLLGGIMFGLAFKNDDADGKTRALQTLVAGAIVIAVGIGYDIVRPEKGVTRSRKTERCSV